MSELIKTNEGQPFATEQAAKIRKGILKNEGTETKIVTADGGWALEKIEKRPKRIPLGTRNVLRYPKRPGYHRHVINDVDDNILVHQQAGYEIVQKKDLPSGDARAGDASQMGMPVSKEVGGGTKGILMEIKQEWYDEDMKTKQVKIKSDESAMKQLKDGIEGGYGEVEIGASK